MNGLFQSQQAVKQYQASSAICQEAYLEICKGNTQLGLCRNLKTGTTREGRSVIKWRFSQLPGESQTTYANCDAVFNPINAEQTEITFTAQLDAGTEPYGQKANYFYEIFNGLITEMDMRLGVL